jgi:hypothetical protein
MPAPGSRIAFYSFEWPPYLSIFLLNIKNLEAFMDAASASLPFPWAKKSTKIFRKLQKKTDRVDFKITPQDRSENRGTSNTKG